MEDKYEKTIKYRQDFLPENYNIHLTCLDCKEIKNIKLFPYRKQYANNKEKRCKKCNNNSNIKRRTNLNNNKLIYLMLKTAKSSSTKRENKGRSCEFNITKEDIEYIIEKQGNKCLYTGTEFIWNYNNKNKPSLDRIDSSKGYIKGNIQLVKINVNCAKNDMSHEEFLQMVKEIYENFTI